MKKGTLAQYYELLTLLREAPLGRRTLVQRGSMTESTVRTHLRRLEQMGYVKSDQDGTAITEKAHGDFGLLLSSIQLIPPPTLHVLKIDEYLAAAVIKSAGGQLSTSLRYRDDAVRGGATGAVLLTFLEGTWSFSDLTGNLAEQYPDDTRAIEEAVNASAHQPAHGDGLVLTFGPDRDTALSGFWHVVASLFPAAPRAVAESSG